MELSLLKQQLETPIAELGYELFEIEFTKEGKADILRIVIDNAAGITIDDCVRVAEAIGVLLDELDPISKEYQLEVTSPGAERKLRNDQDIHRAIGKFVHVETYEQKLEGELMRYNGETLTLRNRKNKEIEIDIIDINLIRLAIKF